MSQTTTTATASASAAARPQNWIYPPAGAEYPPIAQTSNFGPVHLGDYMVLQWAPDTKPQIDFSCWALSGNQTTTTIADQAGPPLTVQLTQVAAQDNASDAVFCHLWFTASRDGNTVVWQFINNASDPAVTWSADASASSTTSAVVAESASSAVSSTAASSMATTSTSPAAAPSAATSSAAASAQKEMSTGTSAGIGVGVALGVLAIVGVGFALLWRRQRRRRRSPGWLPGQEKAADGQLPGYQDPVGQHRLAELYQPPMELGAAGRKGQAGDPQELREHEAASELAT
ncbi:hypothetical protein LTR85_010879 [Meristemomyces frigidus]|nr:hypothetical protein LTR85_010879 [Meristemomyces frigidus]